MRTRERHDLIAILIVSLAVYANAIGGAFIPDDDWILLKNQWVREGGGLAKLLPPAYYQVSGEQYYRPTVTLLYYLEYRAWGDWGPGYHLVSMCVHAGAAALLYLLVRRLFRGRGLALIAALLFSAHPVTTEAVNGIAYREDLLALVFMLGSWLCHLRADEGKQRTWFWPVAWALYAVSLFAKATAVGLPVLILAHDYLFRDRSVKAMVRRRWPAYASFMVIMALYAPFRLGGGTTPGAIAPYAAQSPGMRMLIVPGILAHYLRLMLWPVNLCADYWFPAVGGLGDARFWGPALALAAVVLLVFWAGRRAPEVVLGALWFAATLAPAANIFPIINPMAERYLYVPCAGFCICLAAPLAAVIGDLRARGERRARQDARPRAVGPARTAAALTCAILLVFGALTATRNADWADVGRLVRRGVRVSPQSTRGQFNLGAAYYNRGLIPFARAQYSRVTRMRPCVPKGYLYLARVELAQKRPGPAIRALQGAMECDPNRSETWRLFAQVYALKGDLAKALTARGRALYLEGRYQDAILHLVRAYPNGPRPVANLMVLAKSYEAVGRRDLAAKTWQEARRALAAQRRTGSQPQKEE